MERNANLADAKRIFGVNFLGPDELNKISGALGIRLPDEIPPISFPLSELERCAKDYLLVLVVPKHIDDSDISILSLRKRFGTDPSAVEPCFYNQDWYLKETFVKMPLELKWHLIRIEPYERTRAAQPDVFCQELKLPSANILCFTFLAYYFHRNRHVLWKHDFLWCNDTDHNEDRIYVGRYEDPDGLNKNGFEIHRHLRLRSNYGAIDEA